MSPPLTRDELIVSVHSATGVGAATVACLLRGMAVHAIAPADVLGMDVRDMRALFDLSAHQARLLRDAVVRVPADGPSLVERLRRAGVMVVTIEDASYPEALGRWMPIPPPVLYCLGDHGLLRGPLVCLANSRNCPAEATQRGERVLQEALEMRFGIITGHNRAEYQSAALVARRMASPTCYILDRGLLSVAERHSGQPPFRAARIWPDPPAARDLIISPLPPTAPTLPGANRWRDRLIVALSRCVLSSYLRPGGNMVNVLVDAASRGKPIAWLGHEGGLPGALLAYESVRSTDCDDATACRTWLAQYAPGRSF